MVVKSATKKRLMDRGLSESHASLLSSDRRFQDVENLDPDAIAILLSVSSAVASGIHKIIHGFVEPFGLRSRFSTILSQMNLTLLDHVSNLTNDTNRFSAAELWSMNGDGIPPLSLNELSNTDEGASRILTQLLAQHPDLPPPMAASLVWHVDSHQIIITGINFTASNLIDLTTSMVAFDALSDEDAEFINQHPNLLPPSKARAFQHGDRVASYGKPTPPAKSFAYRPSCSSSKTNLRWPRSHHQEFGTITFAFSDGMYEVTFQSGFSCVISERYMIRVLCSHLEDS